jgi:hypothetical protein
MKRWFVVGILVLVLAAALVGTALAQGTTPPAATDTCPCGQTPGTMPWGGGMRGSADMMGGGMRGSAGMMGRGMPDWAGMDDAAQKLLGMTAEQIQAERLAGKSLVEIAKAKGVKEDALIQAILDSHKASLAKLVADGKLTQAQADAMATRMQEQVKLMVERAGAGPMWRTQPGQPQEQGVAPMQRGGRGGMMGGRWNGTTR